MLRTCFRMFWLWSMFLSCNNSFRICSSGLEYGAKHIYKVVNVTAGIITSCLKHPAQILYPSIGIKSPLGVGALAWTDFSVVNNKVVTGSNTQLAKLVCETKKEYIQNTILQANNPSKAT